MDATTLSALALAPLAYALASLIVGTSLFRGFKGIPRGFDKPSAFRFAQSVLFWPWMIRGRT